MNIRGSCVDALNMAGGNPTPQMLRRLSKQKPTGSRSVLIPDALWFWYYVQQRKAGGLSHAVLFGGESYTDLSDMDRVIQESYALGSMLRNWPPEVGIILNEPNAPSDSVEGALPMTPDEYLMHWNLAVPELSAALPDTKWYVAGQLGWPGYLDPIWSRFNPRPHGIDVHYPDTRETIEEYLKRYGVAVGVGEWNWTDPPSQQDLNDWQAILNELTEYSFWFPYAYGMGAGPGLVYADGLPTPYWSKYQNTFALL